jgi:hypothetical protein
MVPHNHLEPVVAVDLVVMPAGRLHLLHQPVATADYMVVALVVVLVLLDHIIVELLPEMEQGLAAQFALSGALVAHSHQPIQETFKE